MNKPNAPFILLVEDNPDDLELAMMAFERNKLSNEVVVARDGAEAVDFLFADGEFADRDASRVPAVILLDLMLPKVSGLEVLSKIRGSDATRRIPVVILTSSRHQEDIVRSYDMGANSFIRKPVDFDKFVEAVRQLEMYWLVLNESPGRTS